MTPRQAYNIIVWHVLVPITIGIWIQVLAPCAFGCARVQVAPEPEPEPPRRQCVGNECPVVCSWAWTCWRDGGYVGSCGF